MNDIALNGFTDLVNALHRNTSLLYLPNMQESRQMALKRTEDQVKQLRDEAVNRSQRAASVRSKLASKVSSKPIKDKGHPSGLSDQDIKAALGLVDESWARQEYRLHQYLQRNINISNGVPAPMDVDDEQFERPDTAASLGKFLDKARLERTPTMEKELDFGAGLASEYSSPDGTPMASGNISPHTSSRTTTDYFGGIKFDIGSSESLDLTPDGTPDEKEVQLSRTLGTDRLRIDYDVTSLEREIEMSFAHDENAFR
jgi:hypothetical protein